MNVYLLKPLLCGDAKLIPGPSNTELLQKITDGENSLRADLALLQIKTEALIQDLKVRFLHIDNHISELKSKTAKLEDLDSAIKLFNKSNQFQSRKLAHIEDRNQRSNIIVFSIKEYENEIEFDLKHEVLVETLELKLEVKCNSVGRIHRLGRSSGKRPVILFLQDFNEKTAIFENVSKLKGSGISIQNDYSQVTLKTQAFMG